MKHCIDDFAIFGGSPTFTSPLHVGRPNISDRETLLSRINDILDRRWLTNDGPYVKALEQKIVDMLGVKHCMVMTNGTVAQEIAVRAADIEGEVILPSFTFVATAHALQWQQITPVFCDVGPNSHHLDPNRVEDMITPRTTAIIGVHVWGETCDVAALQDIANRHNLRLIFDAAHAFACSHQGRMIGNFGDAEFFSFHATKFVNAFEGGAVTTNDDKLAQKMRYMRNFGFSNYDTVDHVGVNGKMHEVSAAMGLTSLENLDSIVAVNRRNYECYAEQVAGIPGVTLYDYNEDERRNYQYVILEIDETQTGINRDTLIRLFHAENVLARRYFYPGCHQMEPHRSYFPHAGLLLPNTESLVQKVMSLPTGTAIQPEDITQICELLRLAVEKGPDIISKLTGSRHDRQ